MAERVAVVTGAGGQIGRAVLDELTARGYRAIGLDLPAACHDQRYQPCDLTDDSAVAALLPGLGPIDLLVHSAGLSAIGALTDHGIHDHRRVMDVTHFGAVSVTLAALPGLRAAGGRIVLIGSVAGFAPVLGRPAYVAAKHAVTGMFTAIRPELAAMGIGLTIVHPTFVTGGMAEVGRSPGARRATTGEEITAAHVADALLKGVDQGREVVLVGRTARLAWTVSRLSPRLYMTLMLRRLRNQEAA